MSHPAATDASLQSFIVLMRLDDVVQQLWNNDVAISNYKLIII